jgi:hypothetical protein
MPHGCPTPYFRGLPEFKDIETPEQGITAFLNEVNAGQRMVLNGLGLSYKKRPTDTAPTPVAHEETVYSQATTHHNNPILE